MNKLLNYILSTVIVLTFFSACTQEEVDVFAPGNDGAYFRPNSNGSMDTTVNFANHLLDETPEVSIPIDVSILGYINGTGTRRAVIKTKPVEGYDMADVAVDELIFEAGEYQKSVNVRVSPPDTMGKVYAVCLYFDSEDPASQLGMGINGRTEFTIYVTESYSRPSNWNSSLSLYLGAWSVESTHSWCMFSTTTSTHSRATGEISLISTNSQWIAQGSIIRHTPTIRCRLPFPLWSIVHTTHRPTIGDRSRRSSSAHIPHNTSSRSQRLSI